MLNVKDVRIEEKTSKKKGTQYKVLVVEFANGYTFVSNENRGYIDRNSEFAISQNQK